MELLDTLKEGEMRKEERREGEFYTLNVYYGSMGLTNWSWQPMPRGTS